MSAITLPKSVQDSQRFVAWVFPLLLGYGVVSLPSADWVGRIALLLVLGIVITGWQSFGVIAEADYNDVLFVTDLSLLATYWLFLFYARTLEAYPSSTDAIVYCISGAIFFLYAIWDVVALVGRDTAAMATANHLARFAWLVFVAGAIFFVLSATSSSSLAADVQVASLLRIVALVVWCVILCWWQIGRFVAALKDSRGHS